MPPVVIENPILNSPYAEPTRHFRFTDDGITNDIDQGRRISQYFVPIPQPRKKGQQMAFTEWKQDRVEENQFINRVRERVNFWRNSRYPGLTKTTVRLLEYWQRAAVSQRHGDRQRQDSGHGWPDPHASRALFVDKLVPDAVKGYLWEWCPSIHGFVNWLSRK